MQISRRQALTGTAAAVAAAALPVTVQAEEALVQPVLPDWRPAGHRGFYLSMMDEDRGNPLKICFDDWYRPATDTELRGFLDKNPYWCREVPPQKVRDFFKETDGDLVATLSERRELAEQIFSARDDDAEEAKHRLDEMTDNICNTIAKTKVGAAMQLDLLKEHLWMGRDLSLEQQRKLVSSATCALLADHNSDRRTRHLTRGALS